MKRFELWLCDRPWLIWGSRIAVLWPLFVFWTLGAWGPLAKGIREEAKYQRTRNPALERQRMIVLGQKADELLIEAKKSGLDYGPREYFRDLRTLESQSRKDHVPLGNLQITQMQELMRSNCKPDPPQMAWAGSKELAKWQADPRKFVESQISDESQHHQALRGISDEDLAQSRVEVKKLGPRGVCNWLLGIWLRGIPLMLLLYLLRMVEKRGILETVLADKMKFWKAVVDWPVYMFSYPENVVKEVIVEAELRRLGGLFRKLTLSEYLLARRVASSADFRGQVKQLRGSLAPSYTRSFLVALLATLILMVFAPWARTEKPAEKSKGIPAISAQYEARAGPTVTSQDQHHTDDWSTGGMAADLPPEIIIPRLDLWAMIQPVEVRPPKPLPGSIDHVPVFCLGVKGSHITHRGEEGNEDLVRSDRCCVSRLNLCWAGLRLQPS